MARSSTAWSRRDWRCRWLDVPAVAQCRPERVRIPKLASSAAESSCGSKPSMRTEKTPRAVFHAARAEETESVDVGHAIEECADEVHLIVRQFLNSLIQHPLHALREADDSDGVMAAGLIFVGHEFGWRSSSLTEPVPPSRVV